MRIVNEVSRKNLVGKTKVHSPARYNKRLRYAVMSVPEIDEQKLLEEDTLVMHVRVGQYVETLAYDGVMTKIINLVKKDSRHHVTRRIVVRALNERVDETDVHVRCTCGDWKFRFAYYSYKYDYYYGTPETRPANITNPHDSLGAVCKHLACILANKQWLVKAASVVNDFIHEHYKEIIEHYNINEEEFIIDETKYAAAVTGAVKREVTRPSAVVVGATSRLFDPDTLDIDLFNLLDHHGWYIRVDTDLDKPVMVYLSQSSDAVDNPEDTEELVYRYEIKPAGTKVRLQQVRN